MSYLENAQSTHKATPSSALANTNISLATASINTGLREEITLQIQKLQAQSGVQLPTNPIDQNIEFKDETAKNIDKICNILGANNEVFLNEKLKDFFKQKYIEHTERGLPADSYDKAVNTVATILKNNRHDGQPLTVIKTAMFYPSKEELNSFCPREILARKLGIFLSAEDEENGKIINKIFNKFETIRDFYKNLDLTSDRDKNLLGGYLNKIYTNLHKEFTPQEAKKIFIETITKLNTALEKMHAKGITVKTPLKSLQGIANFANKSKQDPFVSFLAKLNLEYNPEIQPNETYKLAICLKCADQEAGQEFNQNIAKRFRNQAQNPLAQYYDQLNLNDEERNILGSYFAKIYTDEAAIKTLVNDTNKNLLAGIIRGNVDKLFDTLSLSEQNDAKYALGLSHTLASGFIKEVEALSIMTNYFPNAQGYGGKNQVTNPVVTIGTNVYKPNGKIATEIDLLLEYERNGKLEAKAFEIKSSLNALAKTYIDGYGELKKDENSQVAALVNNYPEKLTGYYVVAFGDKSIKYISDKNFSHPNYKISEKFESYGKIFSKIERIADQAGLDVGFFQISKKYDFILLENFFPDKNENGDYTIIGKGRDYSACF